MLLDEYTFTSETLVSNFKLLNIKVSQKIIAMLVKDKVTEIFFMADEF